MLMTVKDRPQNHLQVIAETYCQTNKAAEIQGNNLKINQCFRITKGMTQVLLLFLCFQ